ncbi:hypothetical protein BJ912DRAFT_469614 [Pholiota molesta]|nr:hypothetical protein BJ912DRAFT_469614 [Pholiota molesta]
MHGDVHVTEIFDDDDSGPKSLNKSTPTADIDHFFEKAVRVAGEKKGRRLCLTCKKGNGCPKQDSVLVDDVTTLRRHMQARHKGVYQTWCKARKFESMLPDDTKARRAAALDALLQTQVDGHFKVATPEDKPEPYSDELFKEAAIQWLIETDQPIRALEHESFKNMIAIAARATKAVKIPSRTAARDHIIRQFKEQMKALSERLNVSYIKFYYL